MPRKTKKTEGPRKSEQAALDLGNKLLEQFKDSKALPAAMSQIFINGIKNRHAAGYSWTNQLIVALAGYSDSAGYGQWQEMGRQVRKGETGFWILKPYLKSLTVKDKDTGEESRIKVPVGFGAVKVFGLEQTDVANEELWEKHRPDDSQTREFLDGLPLTDVAEQWGLKLTAYNGVEGKALGWYRPSSKTIALGVENVATFAHELIHAADDKLGNLKATTDRATRQKEEIVAELGGAILLTAIGYEQEADVGGAWNYINSWSQANGDHDKLVRACNQVLNRTCQCVALVLETAGLWERPEEREQTAAKPKRKKRKTTKRKQQTAAA